VQQITPKKWQLHDCRGGGGKKRGETKEIISNARELNEIKKVVVVRPREGVYT